MNKNNIPIILGISLPILMILFIAVTIYWPRIFVEPKLDFVYMIEDYYPQEHKLYVYDVSKDESKEVSLEEVKKLNLDTNIQSPDGFKIVRSETSYSSFPLFIYPNYNNSLHIKGHNINKKLNIQLNNQFFFIGWIK